MEPLSAVSSTAGPIDALRRCHDILVSLREAAENWDEKAILNGLQDEINDLIVAEKSIHELKRVQKAGLGPQQNHSLLSSTDCGPSWKRKEKVARL